MGRLRRCMDGETTEALQAGYDSVTAKPLDRALLDAFAELVRGHDTKPLIKTLFCTV